MLLLLVSTCCTGYIPPPATGCVVWLPRSVATLQGNQLRALVASSLWDYLALFRQHKAVQALDPQQDAAMWSCKPVFEIQLTAAQGRVLLAKPEGICSA